MPKLKGIHTPSLAKNYLINSNFDFWQRGVSFSTPSSAAYTADRWSVVYDGSVGTFAVTQQAFTLGQVAVPNEPTSWWRWNQTVAGSASTVRAVRQRIESVRTLAGKFATVTFWAQADTGRTITAQLTQVFGTGGSPSSSVVLATQNAVLTSSWQKFTMTFTVPSISGKTLGSNGDDYLEVEFQFPLNTTMTIDLAQVMVSEGRLATSFQLASGGTKNFQAELALCQRFYEAEGVNPFTGASQESRFSWVGETTATTTGTITVMFKTTKRAAPTMTWLTGSSWNVYSAATVQTGTGSLSTGVVGTDFASAVITVPSGLTASQVMQATITNSPSIPWTASAEL